MHTLSEENEGATPLLVVEIGEHSTRNRVLGIVSGSKVDFRHKCKICA